MMNFVRCIVTVAFVMPAVSIAQSSMSNDFISTELLADAGIQAVWQDHLPLKDKEILNSINLLGDGVYILTSSNYLFALEAAGGSYRFADRIAAMGLDLLPLTRTNGTLNVMASSSLVGYDAVKGSRLRAITVPYGVVAAPAINSKHYYLAADDNKVYAYDSADGVLAFKAAARALITNLVADDQRVVFTTNTGDIVAMDTDSPALKWRYKAPKTIKGRIVLQSTDLFVSGMDTNIYRFDAATGEIIWNFMAGAQLDSGPAVTNSVVYQYAGHNGIYALDRKTGKVLWQAADASGFLAQSNGRAYLISRNKSIIVIDNATGTRIREVSTPGVDIYASNVTDGMIYVGNSTTGRIACLKPKE